MKAYFVVNLCICLALLGGTVFVAQKVETATDELEKLEAGSKEDIRKLSNELSATFTRMGRLEGKIRELKERVEGLSNQGTNAEAVEKQVRQILTEERARRRRGGAGGGGGGGQAGGGRREMMGRIMGEDMPKEQQDLIRKMREEGRKDWEALQKKVEAGTARP